MKVLFLGAMYAYNDPSRGYSYEYEVLYLSLQCTQGVVDAKFMDVYASGDASHRVLDVAADFDYIIYAPYTGALSPAVIEVLALRRPTFVFFLDDTWRLSFVKSYASVATGFSTSDPFFRYRYRDQLGSPVFVPFGYEPFDPDLDRGWGSRGISVSFIGSRDDYRDYVVRFLAKKGIEVSCFGPGWGSSHLSRSEFWGVLGSSRITLNLSNSRNLDLRFLMSKPKAILRGMRSGKTIEQVKARHIEAAAAGACQLSYFTVGLEEILVPGKEVLCYGSIDELPDLIGRCLWDEEMTRAVASSGRDRVAGLRYDPVWSDILGQLSGRFHAS